MQEPPPVETLLQNLADFAGAVEVILADASLDWLRHPQEDAWSLTEVMCHLRDVEREVHQARFQAILAAENPFLSGVSSDEWARTRLYCDQDGRRAAADFFAARAETLALLRGLQETDWQRQGTHAFFGPTTLHELANLAVRHDEDHWRQIQKLIHR